jgi:E3 ubiquitin-protein ligase UBR3
MPKSTFTLILREDRRSVWSSIYVDERGEEDPNIRRGKPLFLDKNRYNELQKLWITGTFDYNSKIASSTARDAPIF